jgi:hypothetical protein
MAATLASAAMIAGCGGEKVADAVDPGEIEVEMPERGDSNVAGVRALLTYVDKASTRILVDGAGPGEPSTGGRLMAHLRSGSCAKPGTVILTLGPLRSGSAQGTSNIGLPALLEGDYAVDVVAGQHVGVIACGDVPDRLPS